jgi:hypothetical protein
MKQFFGWVLVILGVLLFIALCTVIPLLLNGIDTWEEFVVYMGYAMPVLLQLGGIILASVTALLLFMGGLHLMTQPKRRP